MRRRAPGFSLLEVLIALAILGMGIGVILQGLGQALRIRREAGENVRLSIAAEQLLGGLLQRKEAPASAEEGEEAGYRWRIEPRGPLPREDASPGGALVEIHLSVESPAGRRWEMTTLLPEPEAPRP